MNILPQKSWHVRTKRNIERVRRDEEKAAEEEKDRQRRVALAEQEARTEFLRDKAKKRNHKEIESESGSSKEPELPLPSSSGATDIYTNTGHINFFKEVESGEVKSGKNAEYEAEKKAEKVKWEKDIGLLTYLGQSSIESQAAPPWYLASKKKKEKDEAEMAYVKDRKLKDKLDPLKDMEAYLHKKKHKHRDKEKHKHEKHKHKSKDREKKEETKQHSSQTKTIEQLRAERLKREQEERRRAQDLLSKGKGRESSPEPERPVSDRQRKYNSQYNPDFVRQPKQRHSYEFQ